MPVNDSPRRAISKGRLAWLERESQEWESSGIVPPGTRHLILGLYSVESAERRGTLVVVLLAMALCSVGLLLLIGYNWDEIPRAGKLTLVIGSLAAAFACAAFAYRKQRPVVGESLVFLGTLLYGNTIWLVAQILNIHGRFPDAFLWWGLGVLASAVLIGSKGVGIEAAALVLLWVFLESTFTGHHAPLFVLVWPLAIGAAYRLRSPVMLRLTAPAAVLWVFFGGVSRSPSAFWLGGVALSACALYGVSRWHRSESLMGEAWRSSALLMLLLSFIPLTITAIHREMKPGNADAAAVVIAGVAAAIALVPAFRKARAAVDNAVIAVAVAALVWILASWSGGLGSGRSFAMAGTVLFSILALLMAVSLVRTAVTTSDLRDLAGGVAFALLFLIVRWASVVQNLLWSGVFMLSAGAGLLIVARLWRRRSHVSPSGGMP